MTRRLVLAAAALALSLAPLVALGQEVVNQVLAVVGEEVITTQDLEKLLAPHLAQLKAKESGPDLEQKMAALRSQALEHLIVEKLTTLEAKRLGIVVSDEDVDGALEHIQEVNKLDRPGLIKALAKDGINLEEYRQTLQTQILRARLVYSELKTKIIIPEEAKRRLYESRPDEYKSYVEVELRRIILKFDQADLAARIKTQIEAGADFASLARNFSQGPEAKEGGLLGRFKIEQFSALVRQTIADLKVGQISQPVETKEGLQLFLVTDRKSQPGQSYDEVEPKLADELLQRELDVKFTAWLEQVRKRVYVKVMKPN